MNIFVDVLDIPKVMDRFLGLTWGVAAGLMLFVLTGTLLMELHKATEGEKPNYRSVIWTTVLVVFSMLIYRLIFMKIVALCEGIGMTIINYQDWITFMTIMDQKQKEIGVVGLFSIDVTGLLLDITLAVAIAIEEIFNIIRFMFLSVLYLIGPIVFVLAIYQPARILFKGWLLSVIQVSFWVVVLRVFQAAILAFQVQQSIQDGDLVVTLIVTVTLIIACISAPAFTSKLFSGQNIGLLGSTVMMGMTFLTYKVGKTVATAKVIPKDLTGKEKVSIIGAAGDVVKGVASGIKRVLIWEPKQEKEERKGRLR